MKKIDKFKDLRQITISFCVLFICFLVFVIAKGFCLFYYDPSRSGIVTIFEEKNIVNKKLYGNANVDNINLTLPSEFVMDNSVCQEDSYCNGYLLNGEENSSWISITRSSSSFKYHNELVNDVVDFEDVFAAYDVSNELDLLDYYFNNIGGVSIFNSMSKIKMNYLSNKYVNLITLGEYVYKLNGDVRGYMYENSHSFTVCLYKGNYTYVIVFSDTDESEYFNEFNVTDILETVYFR